MPILVPPLQQGVALQEISRASWKPNQVDALSYEQSSSMILELLKIFSQNIQKNNFLINTIFKTQLSTDIIFI